MDIIEKFINLEKEANLFGFKWPDYKMIIEQIRSELNEINMSISANEDEIRIKEEIGDLLHAVISLILFMDYDINEIATNAIDKFNTRFDLVKRIAKERGFKDLNGENIDLLMDIWNEAKEKSL